MWNLCVLHHPLPPHWASGNTPCSLAPYSPFSPLKNWVKFCLVLGGWVLASLFCSGFCWDRVSWCRNSLALLPPQSPMCRCTLPCKLSKDLRTDSDSLLCLSRTRSLRRKSKIFIMAYLVAWPLLFTPASSLPLFLIHQPFFQPPQQVCFILHPLHSLPPPELWMPPDPPDPPMTELWEQHEGYPFPTHQLKTQGKAEGREQGRLIQCGHI